MSNNYEGAFANWNDVQEQFDTKEPEPDEVIYAGYYGSWEGSALVIYRKGEQYFLVDGSHCSCYGLEGQFDPISYNSKEELIACISRGYFDYKDEVIKRLQENEL